MSFIADDRPILRFDMRYNRLYINRATVTALSNPPYVQFLWDEEHRILMFNGAANKRRDTQPLERFSGTNQSGEHQQYVFQRKIFIDALNLRMHWDLSDSYKVVGRYLPQLRMVAFSLDDAEKMEKTNGDPEHDTE